MMKKREISQELRKMIELCEQYMGDKGYCNTDKIEEQIKALAEKNPRAAAYYETVEADFAAESFEKLAVVERARQEICYGDDYEEAVKKMNMDINEISLRKEVYYTIISSKAPASNYKDEDLRYKRMDGKFGYAFKHPNKDVWVMCENSSHFDMTIDITPEEFEAVYNALK